MLDWKVLRPDAELQRKFTVAVQNRFSALSINTTDPCEEYTYLVQANKEVSPKLLPKRKRRTKAATLYNNESVADAREQLQMTTEQVRYKN